MTSKIKKCHLGVCGLIDNTIKETKKNWFNLLVNILFVTLLIFAVTIILYFIYELLLFFQIVNAENFITYRTGFGFIAYLLYYLIAIFAQILIINSLFKNNLKFKDNLKSIKKIGVNYIILTIIINIIFLICSLPLYAALFLIFLNQAYLGFISLLLGYILLLISAGYLIFSPFILIEKEVSPSVALHKTYAKVKNKIGTIIFKLFILSIIMILLNVLVNILAMFSILGTILSIILFTFLMIFAVNYVFVLYQENN